MPHSSRDDLMFEAAYLYYMEGLTQQAIGTRLGYTRWTIGRLIDEARQTGLVTITINHPRIQTHHLEMQIAEQLGLKRAIVVPSKNGDGRQVVARATAQFLMSRAPIRSLAVAWGRTMTALATALPEHWSPGIRVYQTNGGPTHHGDNEVSSSISAMARKAPGTAFTLPAPTIIGNPDLGPQLMAEPSITRIFEGAAGADLVVYSPGTVSKESVLVESGFIPEETIDMLRRKGSVGDILSHYVDADGNPISAQLERRTIAYPLRNLAQAHLSVAVAGEVEKAPAMVAAARAKLAQIFIIDTYTAEAILAYTSKEN
ncbi:hypothetical protein HMPREF3167_03670 [Trueperella sp. HMSC08B05]|nr:hypothetical protein AKG36_06655 [Trueperella bernardiae]OFS65328.1 hypothetical protein HMPREF3174_08385 [Trueperella sp. HMSC08H06]OFS75263.1 hypothetical protein HMPREF3167_03670 [Trueperella sp. HMSC08B05]